MSWESFFAVTIATLILVATPGPVVLATIARSSMGGFAASIMFLTGVLVADLIYAGLAVSGLSYIAAQYGPAFMVVKYLGASYLIYLGIKMIRTRVTGPGKTPLAFGAADHLTQESAFAGWFSGLLVTLGNPKLILFYVSFLPTFVDLTQLSTAGAVFTVGWVAFLFFAGNLVWALGSASLGVLLRSPRSLRCLNICSGTVLVGAGATIALRD